MTLLDDARYTLRSGQRHEAARMLSRAIQREPTNAEAWYLLAEAVDDFQQQTYCMGMAARLGYNPLQPVMAQPEPAPILPAYAAPAYTAPAQPIMPQIVIIDSRPRELDLTFQQDRSWNAQIERQLQYRRPARRTFGETLLNWFLAALGVVMAGMLAFLFLELVLPLLAR